MTDFPKYPSIVLLGQRPEIFAVKEVIAREKIHGSNFRVHFPLGMENIDAVLYGSRDVVYDPTGTGKFPIMHAVRWFQNRPELLTRIWEVLKEYSFSDATIFGEAHGPGVDAKGVTYSDGQEILFRAFDIMVGPNFVTDALFVELLAKMGLQECPVVYRGPPTMEAFDALLEKPSEVAYANGVRLEKERLAEVAEGVVIRSNPLLRDVFGQWLIVKHKAAKFREIAEAPKEVKPRGPSPADDFAAMYITMGRVMNALGHLHDRGVVLKRSMADMPVLLAEVVADLHKEHEPEWQATGSQDKALVGAASKMVGPLYRNYLSMNPEP